MPSAQKKRFVRDASITKSQLSYAVLAKTQREAADRAALCRLQWRNVIQESASAMTALRSVRNKGVLKVSSAGRTAIFPSGTAAMGEAIAGAVSHRRGWFKQ